MKKSCKECVGKLTVSDVKDFVRVLHDSENNFILNATEEIKYLEQRILELKQQEYAINFKQAFTPRKFAWPWSKKVEDPEALKFTKAYNRITRGIRRYKNRKIELYKQLGWTI